MSSSTQSRVSVQQRDRIVPLLPGPAPKQASQPWRHIVLEHRRVGAIEIPEHEHHDFCLHLQLSGSPQMEWWSDGQNHLEETAPGSLILLRAGTRDRLRWTSASERLVLSLKPELLHRVGGVDASAFHNRWSLRDSALENHLRELGREAQTGFALGQLYADLLEQDLATLLARRYAGVMQNDRVGSLPAPKLRRALEFITDNLHRDLRLEEIAGELSLSSFHFARQFLAASGRTVHQYLLDQRIARAKSLLAGGVLPVQDIAAQTGFSSSTNFVRAFRLRVGVPPLAWRSQL